MQSQAHLSRGSARRTDFRSGTTGYVPRSSMEIVTVRRTLQRTPAELERAVDSHAVAEAAALYALA
ncbi:hypothetical protein GCM10010250_69240 [Streptomyces althioticus]|nr:hypothetical protein GCM10010250_69240 [Streptomyces althioticus]